MMIQRFCKGLTGSLISAAMALSLASALSSACSSSDASRDSIGVATQPLDEPISLAACTEITSPGTYALTTDLTTTVPVCMKIRDTHDVTLDCNGHKITTVWQALLVQNTGGARIRNCSIETPVGWTGANPIVEVLNSANGVFTQNTIGTPGINRNVQLYMHVSDSNGLHVEGNTFFGAYQQYFSSGTVIDGNSLTCTSSICPSLVTSVHGSSNRISNNHMDGTVNARGTPSSPGADDGVGIMDEHDDVVTGNDIHNMWDCGIETGGSVSNTTISYNTIRDTTYCGIGGWYFMSLSNSNIVRNTISGTNNAFVFFRIYGLRAANFDGRGAPAETTVAFSGNSFDGNEMSNGFSTSTSSYIPFQFGAGTYLLGFNGTLSSIPGETLPSPSQFSLSGNRFANNDFGASGAVAFFGDPNYAGGVIDGGNNLCNRAGTAADYPLACVPGPACSVATECSSQFCLEGVCQAATCTDAHKNGTEADVDCGSIPSGCPACGEGKTCTLQGDCQSRWCNSGVCRIPTCTDGIRNFPETDIDCGGLNDTCPRCPENKRCIRGADCASGVCGIDPTGHATTRVCLAPTCSDTVRNGGESDIDCGGATSCARCADTRGCTTAADCQSGVCLVGACAPPDCTDGVKNGAESDTDCGGITSCPRCADTKACSAGTDCQSGVCQNGVCSAPTCTDGVKNGTESDSDCGSLISGCPACAEGQTCSLQGDCQSRWCQNGICRIPTCTDGFRNYPETDVDCGGLFDLCPRCGEHMRCIRGADCASGNCGIDPTVTHRVCLPAP